MLHIFMQHESALPSMSARLRSLTILSMCLWLLSAQFAGADDGPRAYRLNPGEVLRFIPEGTSQAREEIIQAHPRLKRNVQTGHGFLLYWKESDAISQIMASTPVTIATILKNMDTPWKVQGDATALNSPLPGDWVVRESASQSERAAALAQLFTTELLRVPCEKALGYVPVIQQADEQIPVTIARGAYQFTTLDPKVQSIQLTTTGTDLFDLFGGGGQGNIDQLLDVLGLLTQVYFINETGDSSTVTWEQHESSVCLPGTERKTHTEKLLSMISRQTGLTFTPESRSMQVWKISKPAPQTVPTIPTEQKPDSGSTPIAEQKSPTLWVVSLTLIAVVIAWILSRFRSSAR